MLCYDFRWFKKIKKKKYASIIKATEYIVIVHGLSVN